MPSIFRFVDSDLSTVRLDLKSLLTTPTNGFDVIADVDLGGIPTELEMLVQEPLAGGQAGWSRAAETTASVPLMARWSSVDNGLELFRDLASELAIENILEVRENGATYSRFYETLPSNLPSHLRGENGHLAQFVGLMHDPFGVPVEIRRQPYSRRTATAGTPTARTNQVLSRHLDVNNPGNAPGLSKLTFSPEAGARFGGVRVGISSSGNLTERATLYGVELESGSFGVDTASQGSVTGASASTVARVSFATNETMERRVRIEQTPTDDTAIQGTFSNIIRAKSSAASVYEAKLCWGLSDVDPVPFVNTVHRFDFSEIDTFDWVPWDLDEITVGAGSSFLVREVHVRRVSGSGVLDLDVAHLFGAEQSAIYSVPGSRHGDASKERWRGDELIQGPEVDVAETSGEVKKKHARVNAEDEVMSIPPAGGKTWVAGVHKARIDCLVFIDDDSKDASTKVGELQVIANDAGAGAWQVRDKIGLWSSKDNTKVRRKSSFTFTVTDADVVASTKFIIRVQHTGTTEPGRKILIEELGHSFIRSVGDGQSMVIDGTTNPPRMYVADSTGGFLFPLNYEGTPFLTVPPDDSLFNFEFYDLPTDPGYDDIDVRGMLFRSVLTRSVTCQVDVVRRDTT